jgi:ribosome maturation factor RimP
MQNNLLVDRVRTLSQPVADELNYELYHIEYVKENGDYFLRIYIDKPGGIHINDCEALSRRVSDLLDAEDFIKDSYYLEVSSPGLNRGLFNDNHYKRFIGSEVLIKLSKAINNNKSIKGILKEVNEDSIVVEADETVNIPKEIIKNANLDGEI